MATLYQDPEVYDLLFGEVSHDVAFLVDLVRRSGGPVLDLGCGTGRLSLPLAAAGLEVVGLDVSRRMLEAAARSGRRREVFVTWTQGDFRSLALGKRRFKTVLIACNGIGHLRTASDWRSFLTGVRRHLAAGGRLIIDAPDPQHDLLDRRPQVVAVRERGSDRVVVVERSTYDPDAQEQRLTWNLLDSGGSCHTVSIATRINSSSQIESHLGTSGFAVEARYGDYDGSPALPGSPQQILICTAIRLPEDPQESPRRKTRTSDRQARRRSGPWFLAATRPR